MTKLSPAQIAGIVKYEGGSAGSSFASSMMNPDTDGPIFVAIALAESGGETTAQHRNSNGTTDYGLWQINSVHKDLLAGNQPWSDPSKNFHMAAVLYQNRRYKFTDWSTYKSGAYLAFMGQASTAWVSPDMSKADTNALSDAVNTTVAVASGLPDLWTALQNPQTWIRVGIGLAGLVLIAITIAPLVGNAALPPQIKMLSKAVSK